MASRIHWLLPPAFLFGLSLAARPCQAADPAADAGLKKPATLPADRVWHPAMGREIAEVSFRDTPLEDVVAFLRQESAMNVFANWRALEAAGIERKAPITLQLKNVTLRRVLNLVTQQVGGNENRMLYAVEDGVLMLSTAEDLHRRALVVVYDVGDLVSRAAKGKDADEAQAERTEELVELITETIDPPCWHHNGGSVGAIRSFGTKLVITQNVIHHREIEELLDGLRRRPIAWGLAGVEGDQRLRTQFGQVIREVRFEHLALADAVDFLRDLSGMSVFVDWHALKRIGVRPDSQVSLRGRDVKLSTALDLVLTAAGGEGGRPGWYIGDGVVVITVDGRR